MSSLHCAGRWDKDKAEPERALNMESMEEHGALGKARGKAGEPPAVAGAVTPYSAALPPRLILCTGSSIYNLLSGIR